MPWKHYQLGSQNEIAKKQVLANVSMGAYEHAFTKKLLERFIDADGPAVAIALPGLDLDLLTDFSHATYCSGKRWDEALGTSNIPVGEGPIDGLVTFLSDYLIQHEQALVVIENWITKRGDPSMTPEARSACLFTSKLAFCKDDIYHVLNPTDLDAELIEDTIREPWHHWFTGVCAKRVSVPETSEWSEEVLTKLCLHTEHIFVPAFDDEGFVIWSPKD